MTRSAHHLPAYALFASLLAAAGLPIYIHAPKFFVDEYGVSLGALGSVLFGLRLLDVVQDPLLGRLSHMLRHQRGVAVAIGTALMAGSMFALFAVPPLLPPLIWFALTLTGVFSAFSFLTICFYAQGVAKAATLPGRGHLMLARWRETGALLGVCVASVLPVMLGVVLGAPFAGFAVGFAVLGAAGVFAMRGEWHSTGVEGTTGIGVVLRDPVARRLLVIALFNAAPVAVTSTLFLFYVESVLRAPGWEGPLLLVFFLSAAVAAPFWGKLAERFGPKPVLLAAMTLLPAMFAARMAVVAPSAAEGFGLWSLVSKFSLAFAAIALLPTLQASGFDSAATGNAPVAITTLIGLYAGVPCVLKLIAIGLMAATPLQKDDEK